MIKGTGLLREKNEKLVLKILRENEEQSRGEIVDRTGLSKNTISLIIDDFIKKGIVEETGLELDNRVGRPKRIIKLIPESIKTMGIFLDKENIKARVYDYRVETVLNSVDIKLSSDMIEVVIQALRDLIQSMLLSHPQIAGIGICLPGIVDSEKGIVRKSTQLNWVDVPLIDALKDISDADITILNSVKANGVMYQKSHDPVESLYYIRIRDGIGGVHIIDGDINFGSSWTAGEIGHVLVLNDGNPAFIDEVVNSKLIESDLLSQNDERHYLYKKGTLVAQLLVNIIHICNPENIIIDFAWSHSASFQKGVNETLKNMVLESLNESTKLRFCYQEFTPQQGVALEVIYEFEKSSL